MYTKKDLTDEINIIINTNDSDNLKEEKNIKIENIKIDKIGYLIN